MKKGWEISSIGDVCERTFNINWNNENGPRKYIDLSTVSRETFTVIECQVVNSQNAPSRAKKIISDNDVLFATTRPTLRRVTIIEDKYNNALCSTGFTVLRPQKARVLAKWLFNILITDGFMEYIEKRQKGASYPAVTDNDVKKFIIPLPPLPEQKRIVKILDKAFKAIDKAKKNAEKNLQNAKELFESYLNGIFANGQLKIDNGEWEEKRLGDVCIVERGSSPRPIKDFITDDEDGVNWIKIGDTKNIEKHIYTTKQKITKKGAEKSRFVEEGDFILSNSMSFGKPYIIKTTGYIHDGWFKLKLHDFVDTEYFYQLLSSSYVNEQFHSLASGSVVKNISGDLVKKVVLPIPPLLEQKRIVKKLDVLQAETKCLEKIYQQKIANAEELKKSILQKAFEGEL